MEGLFYLINYISVSVICILLICWIFYLARALKYRKSTCESYEAEIRTFKEKTVGGKNIYGYRYIIDNIEYFGEIKTNNTYNMGDKVEIFYKRNNRGESITNMDKSKLAGKILGFFIAWIVCNVLFVLSVFGQVLYYNG